MDYNVGSRVSKRSSKVFKVFHEYFIEILRVLQGGLRGVSRVSKRSSKSVQREFGGISKRFQASFSVSQENLQGKLQCYLAQLFQV